MIIKEKIIEYIRKRGKSTLKEIYSIGENKNTIMGLINKMVADKQLLRITRATYSLPNNDSIPTAKVDEEGNVR